MNEPSDIPLTHSSTPDARPCSLVSIIPTLGMSSCRGRAEAFARSLSSKLRTLGSQNDDDAIPAEDEPIINGDTSNTWIRSQESENSVTALQPLRHEDSFFDFDCELESPGSPVSPIDECEYLRLIETASNTPHNSAASSGYACASTASSQSSNDGATFPRSYVPISEENSKSNGSATITNHTYEKVLTSTDQQCPTSVNGSVAPLVNGFGNHHSQNDEELVKNNGHIDLQLQPFFGRTKAIEVSKESPTEETTIADACTRKADEQHLSTNQMIDIQSHIINELQKQSAAYKDENVQEITNTQDEPQDPSLLGSSSTLSSIVTQDEITPITNGLESYNDEVDKSETREDNEVIQIETTEIETNNLEKEPQDIHIENNQTTLMHEDSNKTETATENLIVKLELEPKQEKVVDQNEEQQLEKKQEQENERSSTTQKRQPSSTLSGNDTTDDEDDCRPQRVRRCSSLKTGKTPPGTPGRKKIVRFADVLGLDLADVKTFLDEIPTIPKSAYEDLEVMELDGPPVQLGPKSLKLLMPLFQQPGGLTNFLDLVREKQVSLENAAVTDHINQTITGSVRVLNLDFHKSVHIRYTLDGWRSYADLQANYVENSCDGLSDKFTFVIFGNSMQIGQRLEFAVRFQCKGQQFWDNNYGTNYCFQCLPASGPSTATGIPINSIPPPVNRVAATHHIIGLSMSPMAGETWCQSFLY